MGNTWTIKRFQISPIKHAALYEIIEQHHFKDTSPVTQPRAIILGGQPGAGKSSLLEASKQDFAERNVVTINGDELRYYHPQYRDIQKADERHFAELTDPHARPWTKQLFDRTIETRRNVVFEGTMRTAIPITETMHRLKDSGYYVIARVIAVNERDSMAGIHRRYEEQKAAKGFGRWSNVQAHDDAYKGMPETVTFIENHKLADCVEVFNRKGQIIYQNALTEGEWQQSPKVKMAIETERTRVPTPEERQQHEAEWATILTMMTARRADAQDIQRVQEVAHQYVGHSLPESKPVEYKIPETKLAETGKTYQGTIVSVDDKHITQLVKGGQRDLHIQHERLSLNNSRSELLGVGACVEINYPYDRVGIVKAFGKKELPELTPKGLEQKGFD